jgi:hypothetical protein
VVHIIPIGLKRVNGILKVVAIRMESNNTSIISEEYRLGLRMMDVGRSGVLSLLGRRAIL